MLAMRRARPILLVLAALLGAAPRAESQTCGSPQGGFSNWVQFRLCDLVRSEGAAEDQAEAPSATSGSTALVEKATAPDVFSLALGLVGAGAKPGEDSRATSMTVSAFALRSSVTGENPLNPAVYDKYRNWRRLALTVGRAEGQGSATPEGRLVAVKALVIDHRDVSDDANAARLQAVTAALASEGAQVGSAFRKAVEFIAGARPDLSQNLSATEFANKHLGMSNYQETIDGLTESQLAALDQLLISHAQALDKMRGDLDAIVDAVRHAPQLALTYQALVRPEDADDEHHFLVAFDMGLGSRLSASFNGGVVKTDHKLIEDTTVAKASGELQFDLQRLATFQDLMRRSGRDPMTVSLAGVGEWHSDDGPNIAKLQVKLVLPLPGILNGLKVPVSITFASRTELIDETEVRGNVGFTLDLSKLQNSLRGFRR